MNGCGCGGGGNSAPVYTPPPVYQPSPQELKQRQANALNEQGLAASKKGDWKTAEAFFRNALAVVPNDRSFIRNLAITRARIGEDVYRKGDYATALNYFQQALATLPASDPSYRVIQKDIAAAKGQIADIQSAERQRREGKIAAANMQKELNSLSATLAPAPTTNDLSFGSFSGGKTASDNGDGGGSLSFQSLGSGQTAEGAFGTNVAKPDLTPINSASAAGTDVKAGDQLKSAAAAARAGVDLTPNYDAGTARTAGALVYTQSHSVDMSTFSVRARNDPQIISAVKELDALQVERFRLDTEREALIKQRNAATDPAAMKKLDEQVRKSDEAYQANLTVISKAEEGVEKRRKFVDATVADTPSNKGSNSAQ